MQTTDLARARIDALAARYDLDARAGERLDRYVRLVDWDGHNGVPTFAPELPEPATSLTDAHVRHTARTLDESLSALEIDEVRGARLLADIGSGAGIPGIVLAIALPATKVTLVERVAHKGGFLRNVAAALGLDNVDVVACPLESWEDGRGVFDVVTARRVGRPHLMIGTVATLLVPGGLSVRFGKDESGQPAPEKDVLTAAAAEASGMTLVAVHPVSESRNRYLQVHRKAA